jgi:hypothetical protein
VAQRLLPLRRLAHPLDLDQARLIIPDFTHTPPAPRFDTNNNNNDNDNDAGSNSNNNFNGGGSIVKPACTLDNSRSDTDAADDTFTFTNIHTDTATDSNISSKQQL